MIQDRIQALTFYGTPESPCSYLDNRLSSSVFVSPEEDIDLDMMHYLHQVGFRRSGAHIYRPWCNHCDACQSVRVLASQFCLSRNQKRLLNKNKDLTVSWMPVKQASKSTANEFYGLYERYIATRHQDGDMYPPSEKQYQEFLGGYLEGIDSRFLCFHKDDQLVAVCTVDILLDGPSAIYTYFDPELSSRSLGKLAIIWLIRWAAQNSMPYVYLGYWVDGCQKMAYKIDYQPIEVLRNNRWQVYTETSA